mmetsp:Transcript_98519/g.287389  ORF Transcript_98519/g.287389 Transcript_98519/m.287389 type:complete len:112 (+) Transcript_98519:216-551(+)
MRRQHTLHRAFIPPCHFPSQITALPLSGGHALLEDAALVETKPKGARAQACQSHAWAGLWRSPTSWLATSVAPPLSVAQGQSAMRHRRLAAAWSLRVQCVESPSAPTTRPP